MAIYKANEEGIAALNTMAAMLSEAKEAILHSTQTIRSVSEEHNDTLGEHKASLDEILDDVSSRIKETSSSIESVQEMLQDVADGYQEILDHDRFKKTGK